MTNPRRLFDAIDILLKNAPNQALLSAKESGSWRHYTTKEVAEVVNQLSAGLLAMGISCGDMSVEGRDKIAILSKNRPEWIFLDLAVQMIGAVLVPVYPTVHVNDLQFVLNDAQVKMVFVNDEELFHKVANVQRNTPSVKEIFSFEHITGCRHWKEILSL
ncbi:MAG: AMP-binding protein, partial [Flavisolibacter sp.]|nr:AMP-binding protein [Flavisolibacter sp.]